MRTIKFKIWDIGLGKFIQDNLNGFEECSFNDQFKVKNLIFLQYTGLKDKNGKEIYEGDIVRLSEPPYTADFLDPQNYIKIAVVKFYVGNVIEPHFKDIKNDDMFCKAFITARTVDEVIGNIYENPDLLK